MVGRVREEFGRQAPRMDAAPAFREEGTLLRIREAVGRPDRVLDVACGPGIVAQALVGVAREIVGVDTTPEMVALSRARLLKAGAVSASFHEGTAEALPFPDRSFDAVVTRLSLHHLVHVPEALAEMRRVLRPGGRLVVADVVSPGDAADAALHNALETLRDPTHVRMLGPDEIPALLRAAGFAPMDTQTWTQEREFGEWAAIVADPARTAPLAEVFRALARAGRPRGIRLREEGGALRFTHTWLLVTARG
ncbi:MAG: methyltransferase domain-containing protein [Thermoanaerobaculia bacterium]